MSFLEKKIPGLLSYFSPQLPLIHIISTMVGFAKVEDRPTPASVYGPRIYLAAITAAAAAIMIGYDSLVFLFFNY